MFNEQGQQKTELKSTEKHQNNQTKKYRKTGMTNIYETKAQQIKRTNKYWHI